MEPIKKENNFNDKNINRKTKTRYESLGIIRKILINQYIYIYKD